MPRLCYTSYKQLSISLIVILIGVSLVGCAQRRQPRLSSPSSAVNYISMQPEKKTGVIPIPEKLPCFRRYQDEISYLKQLLAEKDELIRSQNVRELDQAQVLQETASEVSRTKSKLHRLATQPEAASKIAEVEVAMDTLKQAMLDESDIPLQSLAQRLLDAATVAYRQKDYSNAMNYAAQSRELIDMTSNSARKLQESQHTTVIFKTPIALFTTRADNLRAGPSDHAKVRGLLAKGTSLTAIAYHSDWLRVQTEDGRFGWIQNTQVDVRISIPDFQD
jgi:hypothetical protein